ncbi:MFS transporter [Fulvivirga maritima]|uniref:MFS transporter n=1 Tax=Fulvivirga maritima TaxID=2904247 RepID=UPI001F2D8BB0|nr:MFS transporter [Fulvivirga maritima]UII25402.1 MFS transporter [Fulvivirga maritima]
MTLRSFLIGMTLISVVSDSMLHPFFPQFFEGTFGVDDPKHVGYYIAAMCLTVMFAFPFWAYVARRIAELKLLAWTQLAAGLLCLYCFWTTSLFSFWVVSLSMIVFKGSYLLIYPYVMSLEQKENHTSTVGLLSVIVHFGAIVGAILGGLVVDSFNPRYIFLVMAAGDFIQIFVSIYLVRSAKYDTSYKAPEKEADTGSLVPKGFILKLGIITLLLYGFAYMIRPFFSLYWEQISQYDSKIISGTIYAIPGFVALLALWLEKKKKVGNSALNAILPSLLLGIAGLMLQGAGVALVVIAGRLIYGWAIYQALVKFDVLLFELSTPKSYATDYSKIHFFQNLGVLIASFSVGVLVDNFGLYMPFWTATVGFAITLILYLLAFKSEVFTTKKHSISSE